MSGRYEALELKNQLCFPLYAVSREVIKRYTPYLDEIGLTYTQYIAMMVVWEKESTSVKEMGEMLCLDSGTLTPVLKSLEAKGYVSRSRSQSDERVVVVSLTEEGRKLKERALRVPEQMAGCVDISPEEAGELYRLLYVILGQLRGQKMPVGTES